MIVKENLDTTLDIQYSVLSKNEITAHELDEQAKKDGLFVQVDVFRNNGSTIVSKFLYDFKPIKKTTPGDYWNDVCRLVFKRDEIEFLPGVRKFNNIEPGPNADTEKRNIGIMKNLVELAVTETRKKHKKPSDILECLVRDGFTITYEEIWGEVNKEYRFNFFPYVPLTKEEQEKYDAKKVKEEKFTAIYVAVVLIGMVLLIAYAILRG